MTNETVTRTQDLAQAIAKSRECGRALLCAMATAPNDLQPMIAHAAQCHFDVCDAIEDGDIARAYRLNREAFGLQRAIFGETTN